mgnify:CR=1 FL=1
MEFVDDEIRIDKPPNDLDALVLDVVDVLEAAGVGYVVVSGYVVVLFGRARATEDIDVIVERFDEDTAEEIATALRDRGYWGPAMPLNDLYDTLNDGLPVRVAEAEHRVPNVELKFPTDEYDRASLDDTVTVRLSDESLRVGSIELQIAYKLGMGAQKDYEDALYLHELFADRVNHQELQSYVERLGVEDEYDRLD